MLDGDSKSQSNRTANSTKHSSIVDAGPEIVSIRLKSRWDLYNALYECLYTTHVLVYRINKRLLI